MECPENQAAVHLSWSIFNQYAWQRATARNCPSSAGLGPFPTLVGLCEEWTITLPQCHIEMLNHPRQCSVTLSKSQRQVCRLWELVGDLSLQSHSPDLQPLAFYFFPRRVLEDLDMCLPGSASPVPWVFLASIESCKSRRIFSEFSSQSAQAAPSSHGLCLSGNLTELKAVLKAHRSAEPLQWHQRQPTSVVSPSYFALLLLCTVPPGSSKAPLPSPFIPWYNPVTEACYSDIHVNSKDLALLHLVKYSSAMTAALPLLGVCGGLEPRKNQQRRGGDRSHFP